MAQFPDTVQVLRALECERQHCACHRSAERGSGATHCPGRHANGDRSPSLSVSEKGYGTESRVVWHCHAGCGWRDVKSALVERGIWPEV